MHAHMAGQDAFGLLGLPDIQSIFRTNLQLLLGPYLNKMFTCGGIVHDLRTSALFHA